MNYINTMFETIISFNPFSQVNELHLQSKAVRFISNRAIGCFNPFSQVNELHEYRITDSLKNVSKGFNPFSQVNELHQ